MSEILPDLTEQIVFDAPSSESVDVLLSRGVVVTSGVLPPDELESMRIAVDTLYFESLPSRALFKALEALPFGRVTREPLRTRADHLQTAIYRKHSARSQFDPNKVPRRLDAAVPTIDRIRALDATFFEDERLQALYRKRLARLNIADVSRALPHQPAFGMHQDSPAVTRLGHVVQGLDTRWTIHGGYSPSRTNFDYTFLAPQGSVVTTLERAGERTDQQLSAHGTQNFIADGSEVHSGLTESPAIRHRLAIFAEELYEDPSRLSRIRDHVAAAVVQRLHNA